MDPLPIGSPCQDGLGSTGFVVASPSSTHPPSEDLPVESGPSTLTGRKFLLKGSPEDSGYGLYSYVLFSTPPNANTRPRYVSAIEAYFQNIQPIEGFERRRAQLNISYLPLARRPPNMLPDVDWVIANYDYTRAQVILSSLPGNLRLGGPYIVSARQPLSSATVSPPEILYQDLSSIPPAVMVAWFREFLIQAARERFWEEPTLTVLVLNLRTSIERAALAVGVVNKAEAEWRSILATVITIQPSKVK